MADEGQGEKDASFVVEPSGKPSATTHPEEAGARSGQKAPGELRAREEADARQQREAQGATPGARAVDQEEELRERARKKRTQEELERERRLG